MVKIEVEKPLTSPAVPNKVIKSTHAAVFKYQ